MKNKGEYICVIGATALHGFITFFVLGRMPVIDLQHILFSITSFTAFCVWAIYGAILHLIMQRWVAKENAEINFGKAAVFGAFTAVSKGVIDFIVDRLPLNTESIMLVAIVDEVVTVVFGLALISILICVLAKKRSIGSVGKFMPKLIIMAGIIIAYLIMLVNFYGQKEMEIQQFTGKANEMWIIDYSYSIIIMDVNPLVYVLLYISFWFFLRAATRDDAEETDEQNTNKHKSGIDEIRKLQSRFLSMLLRISQLMKNKGEYIFIIGATVLHGFITYLKLGSMPYIPLQNINEVSVTAFCVWAIYGTVLHFVAQRWVMKGNRGINFAKAAMFGICIALIKAIIDFSSDQIPINTRSTMVVAVIDEVRTFVFGAILILVVICIVAQKRVIGSIDKFKIELGLVIGIIVSYLIMLVSFFGRKAAVIEQVSFNSEEIWRLDYGLALMMLDGNVLFYEIFYVSFWFLLRAATRDTSEDAIE